MTRFLPFACFVCLDSDAAGEGAGFRTAAVRRRAVGADLAFFRVAVLRGVTDQCAVGGVFGS